LAALEASSSSVSANLSASLSGTRKAAGSQRNQAHIVPLLDEAVDRSAHAHHGILRLRAENQAALRIRPRPLRAIGVILVRLAARPAGDRVLELVEDADVELVGRALLGKQIGQGRARCSAHQ
jgi:uncharacterized protein (UPF0548 family)